MIAFGGGCGGCSDVIKYLAPMLSSAMFATSTSLVIARQAIPSSASASITAASSSFAGSGPASLLVVSGSASAFAASGSTP
jgi:hypothetical protein